MQNLQLRFRAVLMAGLFCVACQVTPADNMSAPLNDTGGDHATFSQIQQMMEQALADERIPSAVAMVAHDGKIDWLGTVGDMGPNVPMRPDVIMPLASVGKMYTATAAMILVEREELELDDPVSKFIPEFADVRILVAEEGVVEKLVAPSRPISVRHLLTHTSGLVVEGQPFWDVWNRNTDKTTTTQLARELAALPLEHQPGENFNYGPTGAAYEVLGAVIEIVSGQTLEVFMIENIFEPLDLKDSYFYVPDQKVHRLPAFYSKRNGPMELSRPYAEEFPRSEYYFGGGGVSASPEDILRFARLFLEQGSVDGVEILASETVAQMMSDQLEDIAPESWQKSRLSWGYGAAVRSSAEGSLPPDQYGWVGGGYARLWVDPKRNMVAYIAFPLEPPGNNELLQEFERLVYEAVAGR